MRFADRWMRVAQLRRQVLRRPLHDAAALLIVGIVLDLLGRDAARAFGHVAELELPDRQHAQAVVAEHADVEFAALDVLLGDRGGADPLVDEGDAFRQLLVGVDDRGLRDAERRHPRSGS